VRIHKVYSLCTEIANVSELYDRITDVATNIKDDTETLPRAICSISRRRATIDIEAAGGYSEQLL
jgi:hypothetical protein